MRITGKVAWQVFGNRIACIDRRENEKPINLDDFDTVVEITEAGELVCLKGWERVHFSCHPMMLNDTPQTSVIVRQHAPAFKAAI